MKHNCLQEPWTAFIIFAYEYQIMICYLRLLEKGCLTR